MPDIFPLWVSLKTACVATLFAVLFGTAVAYRMFFYKSRLRPVLDGLFTLPLVLPPTVVGFLLLFILGRRSVIGQLLYQLGISIIFTQSAIIIAATVVAFPLAYRTILSAFEQIDPTLLDAARTLGASERRLFWQILLPLAWRGITASIVLSFARALGEFGATLMVGGSIPGITQTIPISIYFSTESGRTGIAIAWTLTLVVVSLLFVTVLNLSNQNQHNHHTNQREKALLLKVFNYLYFRQFSVFQLSFNAATQQNPKPISSLHQGSRSAAEAGVDQSISEDTAQLCVKITKKLPLFNLNLQFQTNTPPLGIIGASGSGKSMTLKCIAGLTSPDSGRITLNERVLFDAQARINLPSCDRKVGFLFQNYALFPHLSVAQNIAFGMRHVHRKEKARVVSDYLKQFGLVELCDRYPHHLSGGQQQRVALARVLATEPDVLLLDEPLSALDTYLRSSIEKLLIKTLAQHQGTTLFVTHKLEEAYRVCPNLLILNKGQQIAQGTKENVFHHPPNITAARITECKNFSSAHKLSNGLVEATEWNCQLQIQPTEQDISSVGIRAHHIQFINQRSSAQRDTINTFPGWLSTLSQTQHRVTLYIKLHSQPTSPQDYHLQAEVYREKWNNLKEAPYPWHIQLPPQNIITMID